LAGDSTTSCDADAAPDAGLAGDDENATTRDPPGVLNGAFVTCGSAGRGFIFGRSSSGCPYSVVMRPTPAGVGVNGSAFAGDSERNTFRRLGRGVAGSDGAAKSLFCNPSMIPVRKGASSLVGGGASQDAEDDVVGAVDLALRFLVVVAIGDLGGLFFASFCVNPLGWDVFLLVDVDMRDERRRDMVKGCLV
jgi:hypothetical protein